MLSVWRSLWAVIFLFAVVLTAAAQGGHTLQGRVITPNGTQPTSPVKVTLTLNGRRVYETFTDLSGRFTFAGIRAGSYQLTAEGDGQNFVTTSVAALVSGFAVSSQLFTQDVQLRPVAGKSLLPSGVVSGFSQQVPKAAQQAFDRAMKLSAEAKPDAAIEKMKEAVKEFPEYFEAHLQLGNQLMKTGRLDEALVALDRARELNPKDERVYQSFGFLLMRQKNYAVAVAVFSEAARLNPENAVNVLMKATALVHQAYAMNPSASEEQNRDRLHILDRTEIAIAEAANLSNKKVKPDHLTLAMFYEMKGERARSATELEAYLEENPKAQNAKELRNMVNTLRSHPPAPAPQSSPR
jgi:cytochrome c-type biogenesis protein CcmH/NrfG